MADNRCDFGLHGAAPMQADHMEIPISLPKKVEGEGEETDE